MKFQNRRLVLEDSVGIRTRIAQEAPLHANDDITNDCLVLFTVTFSFFFFLTDQPQTTSFAHSHGAPFFVSLRGLLHPRGFKRAALRYSIQLREV